MSIITLKRRAGATIGVSAPNDRFSLQGNRRLPPTFTDGGWYSSTMLCSPEDATMPKRASMSNAGMLASRFPKSAYTTVVQTLSGLTHQDFLDHIKRRRITRCPDPPFKTVVPRCNVNSLTGSGSCIAMLRSLERAWSMAGGAPSMPGKTGARDYSEWLAGRIACSSKNDAYTLRIIESARQVALQLRAAADAAAAARDRARDRAAAARLNQQLSIQELEVLEAEAAELERLAQLAEDVADEAQAFLDELLGSGAIPVFPDWTINDNSLSDQFMNALRFDSQARPFAATTANTNMVNKDANNPNNTVTISAYQGLVAAGNGKLYGIPTNARRVVEVDPEPLTPTVNIIGAADLGTTGNKWIGGALAPNGKIYCVPFASTAVLVIDPPGTTTNNTADATVSTISTADVTNVNTGGTLNNRRWIGTVLAPNGKLYGIPSRSPHVLQITPGGRPDGTDDVKLVGTQFTPPTNSSNWAGGVLAPNGKIYCIPAGTRQVLVITPDDINDTITTFDVPLPQTIPTTIPLTTTALSWRYGVLAPNGKIYAIPLSGSVVLVINPGDDAQSTTITSLTIDDQRLASIGPNRWAGGVLGPDGNVYGIPRDAPLMFRIIPGFDDQEDVVDLVGPELLGANKYAGGAIAADGRMFFTPLANTLGHILVVGDKQGQFDANRVLSRYLNHV